MNIFRYFLEEISFLACSKKKRTPARLRDTSNKDTTKLRGRQVLAGE